MSDRYKYGDIIKQQYKGHEYSLIAGLPDLGKFMGKPALVCDGCWFANTDIDHCDEVVGGCSKMVFRKIGKTKL